MGGTGGGPMTDDATGAFLEHRPLLFSVAYGLLGSTGEAEDVRQETWLSWTGRTGGPIQQPRAYLVRIAVNTPSPGAPRSPAGARPTWASGCPNPSSTP